MADLNSSEILPENGLIDDCLSLASSIVESSIGDTSSEIDGDHIEAYDDSHNYTHISELPIYNKMINSNNLRKQLEEITPLATYNNISVTDSTNVVVGNVIKVKGVLNINIFKDKTKNKEKLQDNCKPTNNNDKTTDFSKESLDHDKSYSSLCRIIPRNCWQAIEPLKEYEYIKEPLNIVIISHTATDSSNSSKDNMQIIRNIQTFHIDSQGWDDIGYNFLIGCDGNIYEGRGWGVVGVHTYGYNKRSIGIAFIGNFIRALPTEKALNSCKNLLKRAIEEGHLTDNYKLLGHRQCIPTSSPGKLLFEELTKWEHFYDNDIDDDLKS
ncbi:peptidoglycan recognition protein-like isoform 1-T1 [Cochliomyia hominivorax]